MERKKSIRLFLIYFLMLVLLISPSLTYYALEKLPKDFFLALLTQAAIFSIPVILFYKRLHLYFYLLLGVVILAPFALIPPILFGMELNTDIINLVLNTTYREASELFGSMVVWILIIFFIYVFFYIFLVRKSAKKIEFRKAVFITVAGIVVIFISTFLREGFHNVKAGSKATMVNYFPTSTVYSVFKYSKKIQMVDHPELIKNFSFDAYKKDTLKQRQIYLLVIGETGRYYNWGINGYKRNTSPRLAQRNDFLNFSDVSSGGSMTEESVPIIITRASPTDFERHFKEKGVEAAFHETGFETYWITDQTDYRNIKMHMDEIKNVITTGGSFSNRIVIHDIKVVNALEKVLEKPSDSNLFIILHTIGSHFNYNLRYPSEFDVWKPSGGGKSFNPLLSSNKEIMVNSYDNSILYTDYILDSVMNLLKKQQAVSYMLYVADHGEDLFDDDRLKSLHSFTEPSKYVAHVPFFIWTSHKYDSVYSHKYENLEKHVNRPVSSDNIFETLLDMANITYPGAELNKSIASPSFQDSKQNILGGDMKLYNFKDLR